MFGLDVEQLAMVWTMILGLVVIMYVILDGFDLGIGILTKYSKSEADQTRMVNSIAPFWDGNETWLILGAGALLIAFPVAYAIILQALYLPILFMLLGLILRGVAFEFIFKSTGTKMRAVWVNCFHWGSLLATFFQGIILGTFIIGFKVENERYVGGSLDWLEPFTVLVGLSLIAGYVLLGSGWIIMKSEGALHDWAKKISAYATLVVLLYMAAVSLYIPFLNSHIFVRWFSLPNFYYLLPVPFITLVVAYLLIKANKSDLARDDYKPFLYSLLLFLLGYLGLAISLWPWIVPHELTILQCVGAKESMEISLVGVVFILPVILIYTGYSYYVFRGKSHHESMY